MSWSLPPEIHTGVDGLVLMALVRMSQQFLKNRFAGRERDAIVLSNTDATRALEGKMDRFSDRLGSLERIVDQDRQETRELRGLIRELDRKRQREDIQELVAEEITKGDRKKPT